jgi:hypothetical protein
MMKMLRFLMITLALGASVSTAQARDSFNIGISLGGYGGHGYYGAPAISYHAVPQVIYYDAPRAYYPAPHAYYRGPVVGYRDVYYGAPRHQFSGHSQHGGYGHHGRGHGHRGHHR